MTSKFARDEMRLKSIGIQSIKSSGLKQPNIVERLYVSDVCMFIYSQNLFAPLVIIYHRMTDPGSNYFAKGESIQANHAKRELVRDHNLTWSGYRVLSCCRLTREKKIDMVGA